MSTLDLTMLFNHCLSFESSPNLLREDLETIFSSQDHHGQAGPVDTLIMFGLGYFGDGQQGRSSKKALSGASWLVESTLKSYATFLNIVDQASSPSV